MKKNCGKIFVLFVLLLLSACVGTVFAADTIKIGLLVPLTGFAASDGHAVIESVKIAAEKVNSTGGVLGKKVELVYYDDAADPKQAVLLANKLIGQDKVVALVAGSYSMPTRALAPIFDDAEIPMVTAYALHPDITKGDFSFRNGLLGTSEGRVAAYTALNLLKAKKVALVTADNDFGQTLKDGFMEYLKKVNREKDMVLHITYPGSEKDFKVYLSKIRDAKPDVVFFSGYYFQTGPALKQAQEMGIKNIRFIGEQGADSVKTSEIAGKAAENFIILTTLDRDDKRKIVKDYIAAYRKEAKEEPNMCGASAYDAFMILIDGIKRAKTTNGPAVTKAIASTKNLDGITGLIKGFNKEGEVIKPVQLQIIKDGKFHHFGIITDESLVKP